MPPKRKRTFLAEVEDLEGGVNFEEVEEFDSDTPIIYAAPGIELDTRLNVFGLILHVHSNLLRLHSSYFRKFLDSPDKAPPSNSTIWKYDYVSAVDEDGEWGLEAIALAVCSHALLPACDRPIVPNSNDVFIARALCDYNISFIVCSRWRLCLLSWPYSSIRSSGFREAPERNI